MFSCFEGCFGGVAAATVVDQTAAKKVQLKKMKVDLMELCNRLNNGPILMRLAWHDSGTYDQRISSFPECGGANGAIIHTPELSMGANAGLDKAVRYLTAVKTKYPLVSWADCIQMASACAIEQMGGPVIEMKYGRQDVSGPEQCAGPKSREGFADNTGLPDAKPPFGCGATDPADHLRNVFTKKMGFNDEEIVALSGAHTVGRAFKERSGTCPFGYGAKNGTKFTSDSGSACPRNDGKAGCGMAGGQSWTKNWLTFDNSYFQYKHGQDAELLWFPTDHALTTDASFAPIYKQFGEEQAAFFASYKKAHKKLSELGARFSPAEGIAL